MERLREALIDSSPRRKPGSNSLKGLESGLRRNGDSKMDQTFLGAPWIDLRLIFRGQTAVTALSRPMGAVVYLCG
jgi:hypothetical protein